MQPKDARELAASLDQTQTPETPVFGSIEPLAAPKPVENGREPAPKPGTLDWLASLPTVLVDGRELPNSHRCPEGSSFRSDAERGGQCALVRSDGSICRAPATRRYGLCIVHAGGGIQDTHTLALAGGQARARLRLQRELLGYSPGGNANPRAIARIAAAAAADEIAAALLAPLSDRKLGTVEKQRAAALVLGETFPLQRETVELELPADAAGIGSMDWQSMQALAARLYPDLDQT